MLRRNKNMATLTLVKLNLVVRRIHHYILTTRRHARIKHLVTVNMITRDANALNEPSVHASYSQRVEGPATMLVIGSANCLKNPFNALDQRTYPDFYFNITKSIDKTELKAKFQRMYKFNFGP